ncbi:hypothetical protein [Apilactobacillus kunkeei]|uniref:hypothetical protein n=1 Tax=Apilactobacillus kunkeei TaxID=148814 RepID=UPI0040344A7D
MKKNKKLKAALVGAISAITVLTVLRLNLNMYISIILSAIIIFVCATIIDNYHN